MSSLLHQAVELAQAGNKEEARQLFQQFLQTQPQHEVAWLWLASVATDQAEYRHALNEVLRINPENQRAKNLLAELQQQHGVSAQPISPEAPSPYAPPPTYAQPSPPMSPVQPTQPSSYGPPSQPASPPHYAPPLPVAPVSYTAPPPPQQQQPPTIIEREVRTVVKRGGCLGCLPALPGCFGCLGCSGCGQGCIMTFVVLVLLPALLCGVLSFTHYSLGPLDFPAKYLPGEFGRKTVEFDAEFDSNSYTVAVKVPRSWYLVDNDDFMWKSWRTVLNNLLPFEADTLAWRDLENLPGSAQIIVETDPVMLSRNGDIVGLTASTTLSYNNFSCDSVKARQDKLYSYGDDRCGYRIDTTTDGPTQHIFSAIDPPRQLRLVTFYVPLNQNTAIMWEIGLPENLYDRFQADIEALIKSVKIKEKDNPTE